MRSRNESPRSAAANTDPGDGGGARHAPPGATAWPTAEKTTAPPGPPAGRTAHAAHAGTHHGAAVARAHAARIARPGARAISMAVAGPSR